MAESDVLDTMTLSQIADFFKIIRKGDNMDTSDFSKWIEHLNEPLVLVGFAVMIITGIMGALLKKDIFHLTKTASEKVIRQVLKYAFILGLIVIVLGFALAYKREPGKEVTGPKEQIKIGTKGEQSPGVISKGGKVEIMYGETTKKEEDSKAKSDDSGKKEDKNVSSSSNIELKTEGGQSPAVVGGDVKIHYDKKK